MPGGEVPSPGPSEPLLPSVPEPVVVSPPGVDGASAGSDGSSRGGQPGQVGPAGVNPISTGTATGTGCVTTMGQERVVKLTGVLATHPSLVAVTILTA